MTIAVDVSDFVSVGVTVSPLAIPYGNFGLPIVAGDSNVIDVGERYRIYSSITGVGQDFGTSAPEYLAATVFFEQQPKPNMLAIGRWARTATAAKLKGGSLTPAQQVIGPWALISAGSLVITVDGTTETLTAIDLTAAGGVANLNAVAATVQT